MTVPFSRGCVREWTSPAPPTRPFWRPWPTRAICARRRKVNCAPTRSNPGSRYRAAPCTSGAWSTGDENARRTSDRGRLSGGEPVTDTLNREVPVLQGKVNGPYVDVWCEHCKRDHQHGRHESGTACRWDMMRPDAEKCTCPLGSGDGHRVAHCGDPDSPYADSGYVVAETSSPRPRRMPRTKNREVHVLYRFYSQPGELLYVGITNNPPSRFVQHRTQKDWWTEVSRIDLQSFSTRDDLAAAEREAIKSEHPRYNVTHNRNGALSQRDTRPTTGLSDTQDSSIGCLIGKYFHTTTLCAKHGGRVAQWQGQIVGTPTSDLLLLQLFEWLMGEPSGQELITLADFVAKSPILYDRSEDMHFSYKHGALGHSGRCEG